jgi:selenocysteine lyase/cysteine desulfurase
MIDVAAVRADTAGCEHILHFDNAGASLMPDPVFEAVSSHLQLERDVGGYTAENRAAEELAGFYSEFAALLGAQPDEIAYVENATRAWDMAFYGLPLQPGDRILTHASEYVSNYLAFLQQARRRGLMIDLVPSDEYGQIDVSAMEALVKPETRLIAITHVPTQGGLVNPVEAVGRVAREHGLIYMLDACQSVGQIVLDAGKIGCDVLSGTGRKFLRGPRGTGFLYVRRDMIERIEPPFIDLHSATWTAGGSYELVPGAKRYENWESNVSGRIGLARAVKYARTIGLPAIQSRVTRLAADLRAALAELPDVTVHDPGKTKCAIVSFRKNSMEPGLVADQLLARGINVSVSAASSARLDFAERNLDSVVRASVHYFNTENEIDRFVDVIGKLG